MVLNKWLAAARLRTLPLAFSSIILGTCLAAANGHFNGLTFALCLVTTLFYQILSNYANDYGDGIKGTDAQRIGEQRAVASGAISSKQMKRATALMAILSLISGTTLSFYATQDLPLWVTGGFAFLGLLAIVAAITYTVGRRAYGYSGFGDVSVLLFFGWVGVVGSYFLQTNFINWEVLLPATAVGFLAMGVLNLNNMRDLETDARHGKKTLALRLGLKGAKLYQGLLIILAFDLAFLYNRLQPAGTWQSLYFITIPLLIIHLVKISKATGAKDFEPLLKQLALTTLLFSLLLGIGRIL
jgi:1,4-dihydroxy-2-naphthoate octaprenyltransferase